MRSKIALRTVRIPTVLQHALDLKAKLDEHDDALDDIEKSGTIPSARLNLATNPADTETVVIGGHTFKFVAALGAAAVQTQVKILGTVALTRAAFLDAINGVTNANVVKGTVPFAKPVVADLIDVSRVRVRYATATGGAALAATKATAAANIAVSETLGAAADVWDRTNLNLTGESDSNRFAVSTIAITAAMIAAGKVYVEFEWTPLDVSWAAHSAAGTLLAASDSVIIEGNAIRINLAGGVAPALQPTDVVALTVTG
jgi:hypothetical protein